MKERIISALIALPIVVLAIYFGGIYLYLIAVLAAGIGLYEFNRAFGYEKKQGLLFVTVLATIAYITFFYLGQMEAVQTVLGLLLILELGVYVLAYPRIELRQVFINLIGFVYIPYMLLHLLWIRQILPEGRILVWLVPLIAFGSDTFAYFTGVSLGKHKLAPQLSPKKTIEGAIGGVLGSMLVCFVYGLLLRRWGFHFGFSGLGFAFMGMIGSIFSQIGDLVGSAMKRETGIKDFGHLIPGHGGILDRLDSIIFVAPFVYYFLLLLARFN